MSKPQFTSNAVKVGTKRIDDWNDAQREVAKCDPCGCDDCYCYETICNATTGELLMRYYTGEEGGPYTEVVTDFDTGLAAVKALYAAR